MTVKSDKFTLNTHSANRDDKMKHKISKPCKPAVNVKFKDISERNDFAAACKAMDTDMQKCLYKYAKKVILNNKRNKELLK